MRTAEQKAVRVVVTLIKRSSTNIAHHDHLDIIGTFATHVLSPGPTAEMGLGRVTTRVRGLECCRVPRM